MKGTIIVGFEENSETHIDTQFPINICEFLGVTPNLLKDLVEHHLNKKMEPNYIEMKIDDEISVASFYSGFSFRHYVGKPNFAIIIFLSQDDVLSNEFEGMMRRIAHELLPKREALNFDDILGQYYEMLKKEELTSYWEEIIEGETSVIVVKKKEEEKQDAEENEDAKGEMVEEQMNEVSSANFLQENEDLKAEITELQNLLEEKKSKIRELTRKFTELKSENTTKTEEIQSFKEEISEQYIKLEKWSQQMADLNENNAKLMNDVKNLNQKIIERDDFLKEKERKIEELTGKLTGEEEFEEKASIMLQEKKDLITINVSLNSEIEKLEKEFKNLKNEVEKSQNQITIHIDTITDLKLDAKTLKSKISSIDEEKEKLKDQSLDLKKEVKVLRRERDHYKKIVKENNLL